MRPQNVALIPSVAAIADLTESTKKLLLRPLYGSNCCYGLSIRLHWQSIHNFVVAFTNNYTDPETIAASPYLVYTVVG
ncbi:predicted protein [Plenodomus lingam JN3]|uniref:Predicted protein n=1 Tax=Leptosphaeria maculans (strain JN3 / isolate v23.1.3 / race Av1-4-5-6-7-8) TaxID=985895 RepID=E5A935_LEPMJ|nr:predicted protein [Plenodomus lingam JN3]CBY00130.1 predicted protein [Plenodomus lingam JN3]